MDDVCKSCNHSIEVHDLDEEWPHCEADEGGCDCEGFKSKYE